MTSRLGGRTVRTLITSLEVLSDDEKHVLMLDRMEDGTVNIRSRLAYETNWSASGPFFAVKAADARTLGQMLSSQDASYSRATLDEIPATDFTREKPREVIEAELAVKPAECTELDIERAKAANIAEQKAVVLLELSRDHALYKHIGFKIDGCPACERQISPGYGDGSSHDIETETEVRDFKVADDKEIPF